MRGHMHAQTHPGKANPKAWESLSLLSLFAVVAMQREKAATKTSLTTFDDTILSQHGHAHKRTHAITRKRPHACSQAHVQMYAQTSTRMHVRKHLHAHRSDRQGEEESASSTFEV